MCPFDSESLILVNEHLVITRLVTFSVLPWKDLQEKGPEGSGTGGNQKEDGETEEEQFEEKETDKELTTAQSPNKGFSKRRREKYAKGTCQSREVE